MGNSNIDSWLEWQKFVIREDYKDIKIVIPVRDKIQQQFNQTIRDSLESVKHHGK